MSITEAKEQYDDAAKRILSNRYVIANILVRLVDEFKGMTLSDVMKRIEGEIMVGEVPVEPGVTNFEKERITGFNTEDSEIKEGMVRFDILFYVRLKDGIARMIINIEAQKDEPYNYFILNRSIYYVCRLVSSQKEREFTGMNYNDLKRAESIWICMNQNENTLNHYRLTDERKLGNRKWKGDENLIGITIIGLSEEESKGKEYELHRMLWVLFTDKITPAEKCRILEDEFDIPMEVIGEEENTMCNLSEAIEERAEKRGIEKGEKRGEYLC